jgi:signal recognition particle subunit SRP54
LSLYCDCRGGHVRESGGSAFKDLAHRQGALTEDNIKETLREVRMALLEADVALPVVRTSSNGPKEQAVGQEVMQEPDPGQVFVKIVFDELEAVMGDANEASTCTPPTALPWC